MKFFTGIHPLIDLLPLEPPGRSDLGGGDLTLLGELIDKIGAKVQALSNLLDGRPGVGRVLSILFYSKKKNPNP